MAAEREPVDRRSLIVPSDQPLVGVMADEGGRQVVRYFADDQATPGTDETLRAARAVIGAWEGLEDWDEVVEELDRIRHESTPTPPITL